MSEGRQRSGTRRLLPGEETRLRRESPQKTCRGPRLPRRLPTPRRPRQPCRDHARGVRQCRGHAHGQTATAGGSASLAERSRRRPEADAARNPHTPVASLCAPVGLAGVDGNSARQSAEASRPRAASRPPRPGGRGRVPSGGSVRCGLRPGPAPCCGHASTPPPGPAGAAWGRAGPLSTAGFCRPQASVYSVAAVLWTAAKSSVPRDHKLALPRRLKTLLLHMAGRSAQERPSVAEAVEVPAPLGAGRCCGEGGRPWPLASGTGGGGQGRARVRLCTACGVCAVRCPAHPQDRLAGEGQRPPRDPVSLG